MLLAFYISSHGFGHASRSIELINAIARRRPGVRITIRTGVAPAFIAAAVETTVDVQPLLTDTGMVQIDSLEIDEGSSVRHASAFYADFEHRVNEESAVLRELGAALVVADVPPLAFAAAARAQVPSIAIGNFTWDWIYEAYPLFDARAPHVLPAIRQAYAATNLALRLPLHGGFAPMRDVIEDVPIVARHSRAGRALTRSRLGIAADTVVVLSSFGAHGAELPYAQIARESPFTLMLTDREAPAQYSGGQPDRLLRIPETRLAADGLRYADLVAAADVVVTKPGYGIVSECIANGTALLYTSRGHFPEYEVFVREMPGILPCRFISQDDLRSGRWNEPIEALLAQSRPPVRVVTDGAEVAAQRILSEAGG